MTKLPLNRNARGNQLIGQQSCSYRVFSFMSCPCQPSVSKFFFAVLGLGPAKARPITSSSNCVFQQMSQRNALRAYGFVASGPTTTRNL
eukprot:3346010-Amphidinium_carterae.1